MFMPNLGSFFTPPDPDPWPKNIPDPHGSGSGSETLGTSRVADPTFEKEPALGPTFVTENWILFRLDIKETNYVLLQR